jgi:class I fructose-bisphosphate aldolase
MNPAGYDPDYHFELAIESACNARRPARRAPRQRRSLRRGRPAHPEAQQPRDLHDEKDPVSVQTGSVGDALQLGCVAIGYTIYPGSASSGRMYEQIRALTEEAHTSGLAVVVWSYPRGSSLSKEGETAIDVCAYAAQISAQLGADIIKVKLPTAHIEQDAARKVYEKEKVEIATLADRVRHVVQSSFAGKRIVIFSGGAKTGDAELMDQMRAIRDGGGFGSIIGRNSFQRPKAEAVKLLRSIMEIYKR